MADKTPWKVVITPASQIQQLSDILNDSSRDSSDVWVTISDLRLERDIPGIPHEYAALEALGKCLYVRGFPRHLSAELVKKHFVPFGCVVKCPALISLSSQDVFRWVIMGTEQEANFAMEQLGFRYPMQNPRLLVCRAVKPGKTLAYLGREEPKDIVSMGGWKTLRGSMTDTSDKVTSKASSVTTVHGRSSLGKQTFHTPVAKKQSFRTPSPKKKSIQTPSSKDSFYTASEGLNFHTPSPKKQAFQTPLSANWSIHTPSSDNQSFHTAWSGSLSFHTPSPKKASALSGAGPLRSPIKPAVPKLLPKKASTLGRSPKKAASILCQSPKKSSTPGQSPPKTDLRGPPVPFKVSSPSKSEEIKPALQLPIGSGRPHPGSTMPASFLDKLEKNYRQLGSSALLAKSIPEPTSKEQVEWLVKHKLFPEDASTEEENHVDSPEPTEEETDSKSPEQTVEQESLSSIPEVEEEDQEEAWPRLDRSHEQNSTTSSLLDAPISAPHSHNSWASIATSSDSEAKVVNIPRTKPAPVEVAPPPKPTTRRVFSDPRTGELAYGDYPNHTILIVNLPARTTLHEVSDAIHEGSLASIELSTKNDAGTKYASIVFQYGREAEEFVEILREEKKSNSPSRFRFTAEVEVGDLLHFADERISAMGAPLFATRRLVLVKAGFFFMFGEKELRALCNKLVGADHVQLVWLYNGGNATVIFTDVLLAVKVKQELDRRVKSAGKPGGEPAIWKGLTTIFSKDPCFAPVTLTTTMHG